MFSGALVIFGFLRLSMLHDGVIGWVSTGNKFQPSIISKFQKESDTFGQLPTWISLI